MERISFKEWQVLSDLEVLDSIPEDFEFAMARGELKTIKRSIDRIMKHLGGEGDLEAWVQSKITKANDYLNSVSNHMDGGEDNTKKEAKEGYCSDKCCGADVKESDCKCKASCSHCDCHKNDLKEEKCGDGMYYCKTSKHCKKIPKGHRVGKDGMLVKGVRWQDSDGDGKWYEPGDDVSEGIMSEPIDPKKHKDAQKKQKMRNLAIGNDNPNEKKVAEKKAGGPKMMGEGVIEDLEKGMETLKSITYDSIDGLMKKIAEDHDISTTKLHYMFKAKHDMTPDEWAEKNLKEEMSNWRQDLDEKCWKGYEKKGMKTMFGKRYPNCVKKEEVESIGEEGDNKVISINKGKKMDAKKQAMKDMGKTPYDTNTSKRRAKGQGILDNLLGKPPTTEEFSKVVLEKRDGKSAKDKGYSLKDWFKGGGWVQSGGKYDGKPCAKQPGQTTKPFCRDADDRASMSKDEREKRAAKKRREDPNPDRKGKAKIVTEKSEEIRYCPKCKKPETRADCRYGVDYWDENSKSIVIEKKDACYHKVKSRYSVWPSAYASGALVKCRKVGSKNWGNSTKKEDYNFSNWRDDFKTIEYEFIDIIKAEPLVDVNSITEPVQLTTEDYQRLQSTGNVFCIMLMWRGQPYRVQLFFSGGSRPSREEVKGEVDKLYPGAVVTHYYPAPTDPTQPIVVIQR